MCTAGPRRRGNPPGAMRMIPRLISRGTSHAMLLLRSRWVDVGQEGEGSRSCSIIGPVGDGKESAAYKAHREQSAYRWRVICQACYSLMDNRLTGRRLDRAAGGSRWRASPGATGPRPSTRPSTGRGSGGRPRSSGWTCKTRPDRCSANFAARLFPRESRSRMQTGGFLLFSGRAAARPDAPWRSTRRSRGPSTALALSSWPRSPPASSSSMSSSRCSAGCRGRSSRTVIMSRSRSVYAFTGRG